MTKRWKDTDTITKACDLMFSFAHLGIFSQESWWDKKGIPLRRGEGKGKPLLKTQIHFKEDTAGGQKVVPEINKVCTKNSKSELSI